MNCPNCGLDANRVSHTSAWMDGAAIRRKRECTLCGHRWSTVELPEDWEDPDDELTPDAYQRAAMRTAGQNRGSKLLLNGLMGLNGEAGECIDSLKKSLFQGHELDRDGLVEELGDVLWYVAISAQALGVRLSEVMKRNVAKLYKRYPEGFDPERSVNR